MRKYIILLSIVLSALLLFTGCPFLYNDVIINTIEIDFKVESARNDEDLAKHLDEILDDLFSVRVSTPIKDSYSVPAHSTSVSSWYTLNFNIVIRDENKIFKSRAVEKYSLSGGSHNSNVLSITVDSK